MKKVLIAFFAVLLAAPAFAAVQNVKVSGDITASYVNRRFFDAGADALPAASNPFLSNSGLYSQSFWMSQTRIRIDSDLTDNVSATIRLINEKVWDGSYGDGTNQAGLVNNNGTAVDIDLAYVTLRQFLYSPLTLTVGRQEIVMGNGLIIGGGPNQLTSGHLNGIANDLHEAIAVDGVKAVLDYKPLTLSMFWYKNNQTANSIRGLYNNRNAESNVFGINANYQLSDPFNTVAEGYVFSRFDGKGLTPATNQDKNNTLYVPGLRVSTNPIKGLNLQGELAWQLGQITVISGGAQESKRRYAGAGQFLATYALPVYEKYKPTVNASFSYFSGDKEGAINYNTTGAPSSAKRYTAWDQFGKNQGAGTIYTTLFPLSNLYIYSAGASLSPIQDVTASFTWSGLWAPASFSNPAGGNTGGNPLALYQPNQTSGTLNYVSSKETKRQLGDEFDANFVYNYTEDVTFGLNLGWFVPGTAFAHNNGFNPSTASQAIADVNVKF